MIYSPPGGEGGGDDALQQISSGREQGYEMQSSRSWTRKTEENKEMESLLSLLLQAGVQFKW